MAIDHNRMTEYLSAIEEYLNGCFVDELPQKQLFDAMRYSLLAGGKRLRPVLTLEFCRVCGGDWRKALPFAVSVEMIHTYSLIHDDLPCMDDDDYRRGRPTNHKVYGEATAVLAGDALLTAAFHTISSAPLSSERCVEAIRVLSSCAGELGMVGGQVLDMEGETRVLTEEELLAVHRLKTGCLISAACRLGVIAAGGTPEQLAAAARYAEGLGLAFQIRDDVLDVVGDLKTLGKTVNSDENKTTFVKLYGLGKCAELVEQETQKAISALAGVSDREFLSALAESLVSRKN